MANSDVISEIKSNMIKAMCNDEALVYAIDAPECENGGDLQGTHIFRYHKNPNTITKSITFITVMVHTQSRDENATFITPTIELWIFSHNDHMKMNLAGIKDNRNDYIARLIDNMFNGTTEYGGIGVLQLISNTEGTYNQNFLYRRLVFETVDYNDSMCDRW